MNTQGSPSKAMSSGQVLGPVTTLAFLPRPLDQENGRIQASPVYGLAHGKLRKRHEVVVSVDGETINIYNVSFARSKFECAHSWPASPTFPKIQVQNPRIITSHALPPQTLSVSPPSSIHLRQNGSQPHRFTYAAVTNDSRNVELLCFHGDGTATGDTKAAKSSVKLNSQSRVISVEIVPRNSMEKTPADSHSVLVVQRDFRISLFSGGGLDSILQQNFFETDTEDLVYAVRLDKDEARNGLIRDRDDILARLDMFPDDIILLFVASAPSFPDAPMNLSLFAVPIHDTPNRPTERLSTWALPKSFSWHSESTEPSKYSFDSKRGVFRAINDGAVQSADLRSLQPRELPELRHATYQLDEYLPISPSLALASSAVHYGIYDSKYNSLLSAQPYSSMEVANPRKRKQPDDPVDTLFLKFVSWFSRLGFAVALSGNNLVSIPVDARNSPKRRKVSDARLIDVIGKGLAPQMSVSQPCDENTFPKSSSEALKSPFEDSACLSDRAWRSRIDKLDQLVDTGDADCFDREFASDVGVKLVSREEVPMPLKSEDIDNMDTTPQSPPKEGLSATPCFWDFKHTLSGNHVALYRTKALYSLGRIFYRRPPKRSVTPQPSPKRPKLEIAFYPPNALQWLTLTGQLTADLIDQALRLRGEFSHLTPVSSGDLIQAIVDFDPSLDLLNAVLLDHPSINIDMLVYATRSFIQSLDDRSTYPLRPAPLVTDGREPQKPLLNGDHPLPNGDTNHVEDPETPIPEADTAMSELDIALSTLEYGIQDRSEGLRIALTHLNAFPTPSITASFRSILTRHELIFLIHILRVELADGGWHFRYIDAEHEGFEYDEMLGSAMTVITRLMSCAVDAIGLGGWLTSTGPEDVDALDRTLESLREEVGGVLEGLHEATFLKGLLGEFVRYGWLREKAEKENVKAFSNHVEIVRDERAAGESKILPMGLKVRSGVSSMRVKAGGEVKERNKRDIGREISMRVGKYSFERIRV